MVLYPHLAKYNCGLADLFQDKSCRLSIVHADERPWSAPWMCFCKTTRTASITLNSNAPARSCSFIMFHIFFTPRCIQTVTARWPTRLHRNFCLMQHWCVYSKEGDEFEEEDEAVWNETIQWMSTGKDTETAWNSNMQHCRVFPTIASKKWNVPPNKRFVTTTE